MKTLTIHITTCIVLNVLVTAFHTLKAQVSYSETGAQVIIKETIPEPPDSLQNESHLPNGQISNSLKLSGYLETYYCYDLAKPANHVRQPFLYSYNRHNEVNLNLGYIKLAYATEHIRAGIALMAGTYSNDNLAAEPGVLKNILEASTGFKISKNRNLWIDAGIFSSHIGFESAIGKDCWNLTRSLLAENSPYYESGARISYSSDHGKWFISGLLLNGWQRIYRRDGNNTPSFGHQLTFKPNSKITLNSSSFIGNDMPDSARQMRYFHDFYSQIQLHEKLAIIAGFDIGMQQQSKNSSDYNTWYSPILILRASPCSNLSVAARVEYYSDPHGVIIATGTPNNFQTFGYSLNLDYLIHNQVLWRVEGRGFSSKDKIFTMNDTPGHNNVFLTTSLAFSI